MKIKHPFTSLKSDGSDATQVQPTNWNAEHDVLISGPALLGNPVIGEGAAVEILLGQNLSFDGNTLSVSIPEQVGDSTPVQPGVAAPGVSALASRQDHVHPEQTLEGIGAAPLLHVHSIANITDLQTALTALQNAVDGKTDMAAVNLAIEGVIGAAPAALNTLVELGAALGNDADYAATITTALSGKAPTVHAHAIADVSGLATTLGEKATASQGALADTAVQPAGLTKTAVGLSSVDNTSDIDKPVSAATQIALNEKAGTAVATTLNPGLMSAADKFNLNNAPSPQFLWDVVGARTPIIAHAGDSISYMTSFAQGDNYITQALARLYPARLEYGSQRLVCYQGTLVGVVNGNGTATLSYDLADSDVPFLQSQLAVGKWLTMPTSGLSGTWGGVDLQILSFDNVAGTVVIDSNVQYITVNGPLASFTLKTNIQLKISESVNNYSIAKGGHTSLQIKTGQIPIIQSWTVPPDVMFLNGGTNDGTYATSHLNVIDTIEAALAAGVKIVAVMPMSPKDGMSGTPLAQFISSKNVLATYARNRDGCYLLDASGEYLDPASLTYQPIGASTGSINAVMADGLHPSVRGAELSAKYVVPLLQSVAALRRPKALSPADVWDAVSNKAGNLLGASGVMVPGAGGKWNNANSTPGTAAGWEYLTHTVASPGGAATPPVPTITSCEYVAANYLAQRISLDGLYAANDGRVFSMTYTRYNENIFGQRLDAELLMRINCPNIYAAGVNISVTGGVGTGDSGIANLGTSTQRPAGTITPSATDWLFITLARPMMTFNQPNNANQQLQFIITVKALNDAPLSGFIEIAHCGAFAMHTS